MGKLIVVERVSLPHIEPAQFFDYLLVGGLPSWRVPPGSRIAPGTPVSVSVTLPPALGGDAIDILGRVHSIDTGRRIVVHHDLPWQGRVSVLVKPDVRGGSTVTLHVELGSVLLNWARQRMSPIAELATASAWRIGMLTSGSGPASVFSISTRHTATMAVEEVNADGGVAGRPLELLIGDDGTHPGLGAAELVRLAYSGCQIVLANVTSEVFTALRPVARRHGVLIIHTPVNEGGEDGAELLRFGERPFDQAAAVIPALMRATGGSRFFLAGSDYIWPRGAHRAVRRVVAQQGGAIAGEAYPKLGCQDFGAVIESIDSSGADLVISTFIGADEVSFEQQMHAAGMRGRVSTLAMVLDESTHAFIGPDVSDGLWAAFSYFDVLDTAENQAFKQRYRERFGSHAPPVSSMTEAVYEAVHLVARAGIKVNAWDPVLIGESLRAGVEYVGPRGRISTGPSGLRQPLYVAQAVGGQLRPAEKIEPVHILS